MDMCGVEVWRNADGLLSLPNGLLDIVLLTVQSFFVKGDSFLRIRNLEQ